MNGIINDLDRKLRVIKIILGTTVDGPGIRTSIYFAGCKHACPFCHNPETWPLDSGYDKTIREIIEIVKKEENSDVTFSGGDPLYQNLENLSLLAKEIHKCGKKIWMYTGFKIDELTNKKKYEDILNNVDVIVDGPFKINEKSFEILFRGSTNQNILRKDSSGKWVIFKKYNNCRLKN